MIVLNVITAIHLRALMVLGAIKNPVVLMFHVLVRHAAPVSLARHRVQIKNLKPVHRMVRGEVNYHAAVTIIPV